MLVLVFDVNRALKNVASGLQAGAYRFEKNQCTGTAVYRTEYMRIPSTAQARIKAAQSFFNILLADQSVVEQLNPVPHCTRGAALDMRQATDVGGGDRNRFVRLQRADLVAQQLL